MVGKQGTYSKMRGGVFGKVGDVRRLYRIHTEDMEGKVQLHIAELGEVTAEVSRRCGFEMIGKKVLIVGAGSTQRETMGFAVSNHVTAIDLNVVPDGWGPRQYVQLARENGTGRAIRTVGRKVLGIDRHYRKTLHRVVGSDVQGSITRRQMDASKIALPDDSFDLVYSYSVFEHLPDPLASLSEIKRVLRPGGMFYLSTHIYTAENGAHDLRIFAEDRAEIPFWAHLRLDVKSTVIESCYLNEWSLADWRELFTKECEGIDLRLQVHTEPHAAFLRTELDRLRASGYLNDYTDEELLAVNLQSVWVKPVVDTKTAPQITRTTLRASAIIQPGTVAAAL